jgi:hypothetical protein
MIKRYTYQALRKKVLMIGVKSRINKPLDFYNLRHSACYISKIENTPVDLASEKFGHSAEYYINTYGRLDTKDKIKRFKKQYKEGAEKDREVAQPVQCGVCDFVNNPGKEECEKCGNPLTLKKALEVDKGKNQEMADLKKQMDRMNKILEAMQNEKEIEGRKK